MGKNWLIAGRVNGEMKDGEMKGRGCAKPTIELVQTGPSLILKFKKTPGPVVKVNAGCVATPTFPPAPLDFECLALLQVYTFFRWRL